jgi:hypothetical protein
MGNLLKSESRKGMAAMRFGVERLLRSTGPLFGSEEWPQVPDQQLVNYLLSFLFHPVPRVKWRTVTALGIVVNRMAHESLESARNIMRRLIWSLNDESGGIGWGSAETMGEIMAVNELLAREYHCILLSYVQKEGNPLENPLLERGVLWGIGRLAQVRAELVEGCGRHLMPYLQSGDPIHRGYALWALGFLKEEIPVQILARLKEDRTEVQIYEENRLEMVRICDLARRLDAGDDGRRLVTG